MQIVLNVKWGPYKEVLSPGNRKQSRKVTLKGCSHHRPRKPNNRRYPLPFHSGFEVNIKYPVLLHVEYLYLSHQGNIFCLVEYFCLYQCNIFCMWNIFVFQIIATYYVRRRMKIWSGKYTVRLPIIPRHRWQRTIVMQHKTFWYCMLIYSDH